MSTKIIELCKEFREGLEYVSDNRLYGRLNIFARFPKQCCRYTSDLLATYLMDNGISFERICMLESETIEEGHTHCWLMIDNSMYVDITADQFNSEKYFDAYHPISKCIVNAVNTGYYTLFDKKRTYLIHNVGLCTYNYPVSMQLKLIYEEVQIQINKNKKEVQ